MLSNKTLLYGLGIGLIIGAILVQLMNAAVPKSNWEGNTLTGKPALEDYNVNQIKELASKYFKVFEKEDKVYNQQEVDNLIQQKLKEEKDKQGTADAGTGGQHKETYVYVSKGLVSSNVADMLYQSGVITDRKAFEDEMNKKELNDKIVTGIHVFKGPQELSQVISNITSP